MKNVFNGLVTREKVRKNGFLNRLVKITPPSILTAAMKWHYCRITKSFSEDQIYDLKIGRHLINTNDHVVDVGANVGIYTKILSKLVGNEGLVYSIEPIPSTFQILTHAIKRLRLENVYPINCAISDIEGTVTMTIPKNDLGIENHYLAEIINSPQNSSTEGYQVSAHSLDALLPRNRHCISFIKIDTEGHEMPCIKGAREIISRWKPALLVEINSNESEKSLECNQIIEILSVIGYNPYVIDGVSVSKWHPGNRSVNFFFLTSEHIEKLKSQNLYNPTS